MLFTVKNYFKRSALEVFGMLPLFFLPPKYDNLQIIIQKIEQKNLRMTSKLAFCWSHQFSGDISNAPFSHFKQSFRADSQHLLLLNMPKEHFSSKSALYKPKKSNI